VGEEYIALKTVTFLSSFLVPLYCIAIYRQIDNSSPDWVSLIAGALALLYPLANQLSTIALLDTLVTLIFLIIIHTFLMLKNVLRNSHDSADSCNSSEIRFIGFISFMLAIALTITTLIRFSYGILIVAFTVVIIYYVFQCKQYKIQHFLSYAIGGMLMGIPWLIRNVIYRGSLFYTQDWERFSIYYLSVRLDELMEYYVFSDDFFGLPMVISIIIVLIIILLYGVFNPNFIERDELKDIGWILSFIVISILPFFLYIQLQDRFFLSAFIFIPVILTLALKDEKTMIPPLLTAFPYLYYTFSKLSSYWFILSSINPAISLPNPENVISSAFLIGTFLIFLFLMILILYLDRTKEILRNWIKLFYSRLWKEREEILP
jgi:hypothetical protein